MGMPLFFFPVPLYLDKRAPRLFKLGPRRCRLRCGPTIEKADCVHIGRLPAPTESEDEAARRRGVVDGAENILDTRQRRDIAFCRLAGIQPYEEFRGIAEFLGLYSQRMEFFGSGILQAVGRFQQLSMTFAQ